MYPRSRQALPFLLVIGVVALAGIACSGDDDSVQGGDDRQGTASPTATAAGDAGGPEPQLSGPASRFAPVAGDLEGTYFPTSLELTVENYAADSPVFDDAVEGEQALVGWEYIGGYQADFEPEHREQDVLNGLYYANTEVHLFGTIEGASAFYHRIEQRLETVGNSQRLDTAAPLANESGAWAGSSGVVGDSDVSAVFHWYMFRRGNLVGIVRTWGALPYMDGRHAHALAAIIDGRALSEAGETTSTVATPTGGAGR